MYGILGWGTASENSLSKLRVLQNRAVRFITFSPFRTSAAPLYASLEILPLEKQHILQTANFMHSLHYKNVPSALSTYCHQPRHNYNTRYRTSLNYVVPKSLTNRAQCSIKYTGPKVWANVPIECKEIAFRKPFAKKFKNHILSEMQRNLPPTYPQSVQTDRNNPLDDEMVALFDSDDEESDFLGFEFLNSSIPSHEFSPSEEMIALFESDDEEEFLGFSTPDSSIKHCNVTDFQEIMTLFESDTDSTFLGFDNMGIEEIDTFSQNDVENDNSI